MGKLWLIFSAIIVAIGSLVALFLTGAKSGKESIKNEELSNEANTVQKINETDNKLIANSDDILRDKLREFTKN